MRKRLEVLLGPKEAGALVLGMIHQLLSAENPLMEQERFMLLAPSSYGGMATLSTYKITFPSLTQMTGQLIEWLVQNHADMKLVRRSCPA